MHMWAYLYVCRLYRLLKYLCRFKCVPLPRQLLKHRAKQNKNKKKPLRLNNVFSDIAKCCFGISSSPLAVQDSCLQLISYLGPTATAASTPPAQGWEPKGWACVCSRRKRQGEKSSSLFFCECGEKPPGYAFAVLSQWGQRALQEGSRD